MPTYEYSPWRDDSPTGRQIALDGYRQSEPNCFGDRCRLLLSVASFDDGGVAVCEDVLS
jgi:hypothetical protein